MKKRILLIITIVVGIFIVITALFVNIYQSEENVYLNVKDTMGADVYAENLNKRFSLNVDLSKKLFETITTSSLHKTDGIRTDDVAYRIVLKGKSGESDNIFTYNDNNVMINDVYYSISDDEYSKLMSNIAYLCREALDANGILDDSIDSEGSYPPMVKVDDDIYLIDSTYTETSDEIKKLNKIGDIRISYADSTLIVGGKVAITKYDVNYTSNVNPIGSEVYRLDDEHALVCSEYEGRKFNDIYVKKHNN